MYSQCKRYYDSSDSAAVTFYRRRLWIGLSFVAVLLAVFVLPNRARGSAAGRIYWTDRETHKIQCAGIDGSNPETLRTMNNLMERYRKMGNEEKA
jgi:hypothetical protein